MADGVVQVAPDSTGKMLQTFSRTVGSNTVHRQVMVAASARTRTGMYRGVDNVASGQAILLAAHTALATTAGTGFLFLTNPTGSSVTVAVKKVQLSFSANAATPALTTPRIQLSRFTYTGTISTASLAAAKRVNANTAGLTADAAATAKLTISITGQTTTSVTPIRAFLVPAILTAVGTYGQVYIWEADPEDEELILAPGEGLAIQQMDAGTTSDPRRVAIGIGWEEFTAP